MTCRWFLLTAVAAALCACGGGEATHEITDIRERPRTRPMPVATSAQRFGFDRTANPHGGGAEGAPKAGFVWKTPEGWKELPPTEHRRANFQVAGDPDAECFLSLLSGGGGGLVANVNRWRRQMGLPPLSAEEINALPRRSFGGESAVLVEAEGAFGGMSGPKREGFALVGLVLALPNTVITLKMTGPKAIVAKEKGRFEQLAAGIRPAGHGAHGGHGGGTAPPARPASFKWKVPEGWVKGPDRGQREVTFHPQGAKNAQCYVSVFGGTVGGVNANVNRWRMEVGMAPLGVEEIKKLPTVEVFGQPSKLVEAYGNYTSHSGGEKAQAGLLGVIRPLTGRVLFVKLVGPVDLVKKEKANFIAFCNSLEEAR